MLSFDIEVNGPYASQPLLVKIGCWLMLLAFALFGLFLPTSLVVAVIGGVGGPAANWVGVFVPIVFCLVFGAVGAWVNGMFVYWLSGEKQGFRPQLNFLLITILVSAVTSTIGTALGFWQEMFLGAGALVLICIVLASIITGIGQLIAGKQT